MLCIMIVVLCRIVFLLFVSTDISHHRSHTTMRRIPFMRRHTDMWGGNDIVPYKMRGVILHTDRYQVRTFIISMVQGIFPSNVKYKTKSDQSVCLRPPLRV